MVHSLSRNEKTKMVLLSVPLYPLVTFLPHSLTFSFLTTDRRVDQVPLERYNPPTNFFFFRTLPFRMLIQKASHCRICGDGSPDLFFLSYYGSGTWRVDLGLAFFPPDRFLTLPRHLQQLCESGWSKLRHFSVVLFFVFFTHGRLRDRAFS